MIRKAVMFAFIAFSLFTSVNSSKAINPMPTCDPCPWVR